MNSRLNVPARVTLFAVLTLLVIAAALTLPKLSSGTVFAQATPGAPTNLTATAVGETTVELSWTAPIVGRDSIRGYRIEHSTNNGGAWSDTAPNGVPNTEASGTQNVGVDGIQTYYSVTATALSATVTSNLYRVSAIGGTAVNPTTGPVSDRASAVLPVATAQPGAPTDVMATANGSTEINLTWTAPTATGVGSITSYKIEYSKNNLLPWMEVGTTTVTPTDDGTEYSDTGLDPDTTRYYRVSAVNSAGRGPASSTDPDNNPNTNPHMAKTALTGVPAAPTGLKALAVGVSGANAVELKWTAPNEGNAPITSYRIESFGDHDNSATTPDTWSTETDDGGVANTEISNTAEGIQTYHAVTANVGKNVYRVSAMNTIGTGPVSATVTVTPPVATAQPGAPQNLEATPDGSREIELTWEAPSDTGATPITKYEIEYSKDGSLPWMPLVTVGNVLKYENFNLSAGTERHYRVSARNSVGRGPASATATATTNSSPPSSAPGKPASLTATAVRSQRIELSWSAAATTDRVTGYMIERSINDGTSWTTAEANTEAPASPGPVGQNTNAPGIQTYYYDEDAALAGQDVLYRVSAINDAGTGPVSDTASATPPVATAQPGAPTDVMATANGSTEINLTWTAPTATGAGSITSYKIEYSKNNLLPWMEVGTTTVTPTDDGTEYSDTRLDSDTTRYYRVSAINLAGRGPASTTPDATGTPPEADHMAKTALAGVPAAPMGLRAIARSATEGELYWTAPTDDGRSPISDYKVEYSADGTTDWTELTNPAATSGNKKPYYLDAVANTTDRNSEAVALAEGVKRHYRVSAINALGMGPVSATVVLTPPTANTQPGAPTVVMARADGSTEIDVSWTAAPAGATPTTGYVIEYSKDNDLPWMEVATVGNVTRYSDTGLDPDTTRYYRVSAVNSAGRGPASSTDPDSDPNTNPHMAKTDMGPADQMGTVALSTQEPTVGRPITATLKDDDSPTSAHEWQWQKSMTPMNMNSWMDATGAGATTATYTPVVADVGYYLRATVTYTDKYRSGRPAESTATDSMVAANNAPEFADATATRMIEENSAEGTDVGEPVTAMDPDEGDMLTYSLDSEGDMYFDIDNMGQITVGMGTMLDHEDEDKDSYSVTVTATDLSMETDTIGVTITVTDVNEAPVFTDATAARSIDENSAEGTDVGEPVTAMDPDEGDMLTYSLDSEGDMYFDIDNMGQITVGMGIMLDHEDKDSYSVMVTATDSSGMSATIDVTVTITVMDVNEAPIFNEGDTATRSIAENTEANTDIGDALTAADPENDQLSYSLGGDDAASFDIDPATGQLMTKAALDYETKSSYSVTVTATETETDPGLSATIDVTITVTDVDEAPVITGGPSEVSFAENGMGAIGTYTAMDPEGADITWSLSGTDMEAFDISDAGVLTFKTAPDFEAPTDADQNNVYMITVTASDGTNTAEMGIMVTVTVTDVDEGPELSAESYSATVAENSAGGTDVDVSPAISATSADSEATLTFSLSGDGSDNFAIDGGAVTVAEGASLDYETTMSYSLTVTVSDGTLSDTAMLDIMVTNVEEDGSVTLSSMKPVVGAELTATLMDYDMVMEGSVDWQWSRSMTLDGTFEHIAAESMSYTPVADDVGYYLQVVATYTDGYDSGNTEMATTSSMVVTALMAKHDNNGDGVIDVNEVVEAMEEYQAGEIDINEVIAVMEVYQQASQS